MAEGDEFFALNPGMFADRKCWSYNDLRRLSRDLGLGGKGKRVQLEAKLTSWHRQRTDAMTNLVPSSSSLDGGRVDDIPMNVEGSNFSVLPIALGIREDIDDDDNDREDGHDAKRRRRSSFLMLEIDNKENQSTTLVSPFVLRPLRSRSDESLHGTPGKGILKIDCGERSPVPPNKLANITFSPFNGVRVIPHRSTFEDSGEENEEGDDNMDNDEDEEEGEEDDDMEAGADEEEDLLDEASEESDDSAFSIDDDGF